MQNKAPNFSKKAYYDPERALAAVMLVLLVFQILLVSVTLIRTLAGAEDSRASGRPTGGAPVTPPDPPAIDTVFSGGVIPSMPQSDGNTVKLTDIHSQNAILVNAEGRVIAEKDPDVRFSPASLTKVMTLIVACEKLPEEDLDKQLKLTWDITEYVTSGSYAGSSVGLIDGEKYLNDTFVIRDLLYGIGVSSSADCTVMIASHICPAASPAESEAAFVALMNQKAEALGLTNTHFDNVIGNDSRENYSTARELSVIMSYAMQCELIASVLNTDLEQYPFKGHYVDNGVNKEYNRYFSNTFQNRLPTYERYVGAPFALSGAKMVAGKTGSFVTSHFIACALESKTTGADYVLILGPSPQGTQPASVGTLRDIKTIADRYIP